MSALLRVSKIPRAKFCSAVITKNYATESPRTTLQPDPETFAAPSKPRPYYAKHPRRENYPVLQKTWPTVLAFVGLGVAGWGLFMMVATNQEKISSSVVRQIMRSVREDAQLKETLGEAIRPQPEWWLNGDPRIHGRISQLQGNVDVSFRIRGSKGSGTLYFTSIRKDKGLPFSILRFKVICDDGTIIHVDSTPI
ncbi:cytochrome oxidase complex assembly protein 1-domain-containing protein [Infundibulicybe gibba]|nr:cytochrome oxidase complex assembly protein 1-domain-containing protein [Infundibulicybe gibba]